MSLMAAVTIVYRSRLDLRDLPHTAQSISQYADSSCELWSFESLRRQWNFVNVHNKRLKFDEESAVRLQDRLLAHEWAGLSDNFLQGRFRYGLKFISFNMPMMDSWLIKYMPLPLSAKSLAAILTTAMENNRIKVLE